MPRRKKTPHYSIADNRTSDLIWSSAINYLIDVGLVYGGHLIDK